MYFIFLSVLDFILILKFNQVSFDQKSFNFVVLYLLAISIASTYFKWSIIVPVHRPNIGKWRCPWQSGGDTTSAYRARFWMKFQTALVERFCVFQRCLPGHQISDWEPQSEFGSWSWEPQSKSKLEPQKALRYLGGGDTKWAPAVAATAVN